MSDILINNIGRIVSGDLQQPFVDGDAVVIRQGRIAEVGYQGQMSTSDIEQVIDAGGCMLWPGLIDSHFHPVIGDFTPRQLALDYIDSCLHGGVTSMISAGEVHIPGRPKEATGLKALAILAAKTFENARPAGVKVLGGGLILAPDMTEADFKEMAAAGVTHLGEIGLGSVNQWDQAAQMAAWAHQYKMKVMMHTGGASIPGSNVIGAEAVLTVKPDIASHLNGGPTALPLEEVERIIVESQAALEVVQCGNVAVIRDIVLMAQDHNALDRIIVGNDMPSGTGVIPLGVLRTLSWISSLADLPPEQAIAMATGNTARIYNFNRGRIVAGLEADLVIADAPLGSRADTALDALRIGDTPAVSAVLIDGQVKVYISRNTPPPKRKVTIPWMKAGGH
ncbi:MAG: amidohydrolase family protein [Anaerolineales bacterium]|nr:amidohydrolase family protein [Anaerolineales bacterium]